MLSEINPQTNLDAEMTIDKGRKLLKFAQDVKIYTDKELVESVEHPEVFRKAILNIHDSAVEILGEMKDSVTTQRVRVRIAVAVNSKCEWAAFGFSKNTDAEMKEAVFVDDMADGEQFHWIEADVPVPQEQTVEGEVT